MDPVAQLHSIVERPLRFGGILVDKLGRRAGLFADLLVGSRLGSLDAPLPLPFIRIYQALLVATALCDSRAEHGVGARIKLIGLVVAFGEFVLICTLAYLFGTRVGAGHISGMQGRYFIPISPLLLLPLYSHKVRATLQAAIPPRLAARELAVLGIVAFLLLSALVTGYHLIARYYA